jgi:hypothetical protein
MRRRSAATLLLHQKYKWIIERTLSNYDYTNYLTEPRKLKIGKEIVKLAKKI